MQPSSLAGQEIAAPIDRLPHSSPGLADRGWQLVGAYELFMPGFISIGLIRDGIYTATTKAFLDFRRFPSFLAAFFAAMFLSTLLFGWLSDKLGRRSMMIAFGRAPEFIGLWRFLAGLAVGVQLIKCPV
jgi:putative MFS transporter